MAAYRVLSLDGGGIRGLLSLVLLDRIRKEVPGWLDKADLLASTSTGGIIALGIAHGVPLADIRALYEQRAGTSLTIHGSTTSKTWATLPGRSTATRP